MIIVITGTTSGVGLALTQALKPNHTVVSLNRHDVDLSDITQVQNFSLPHCDILINCAGTGIGGKIDFVNHNIDDCVKILNVNTVSPVLLTHKALKINKNCKIVNITSTNNNRYWPNDLVYSLSKKSLSEFSKMLKVEYASANVLEVCLGLTKTNFNDSRYKNCADRHIDIYSQNPHLEPATVAGKIVEALFDDTVKYIEIAP